ncbi:MAG: universal stress protein [Alphaproteobacteria bacterium]
MKRFRNILYVADPVVEQGEAFERAVTLAENTGARLTIAEVNEPIPSFVTRKTPYKLREIVTKHRESELKKMCQSVGRRIKIEAMILEGKFFLEIVREVLRNGRDLVIKPAEGGSVIGRLFGSNDLHLLRKCPCPVWLIKLSEDHSYRSIMAAVDFNEDDESEVTEALNRQILELAMSLAHSEDSELHVCHAWYPPYEDMMKIRSGMSDEEVKAYVEEEYALHKRSLDRLMGQAKKWTGEEIYESVRPKMHLGKGDARNVIPELARELHADLVVMGTVARTGIPGLLIGNTAETILDQLDCSVLAVKPPGFVSPVTLERES